MLEKWRQHRQQDLRLSLTDLQPKFYQGLCDHIPIIYIVHPSTTYSAFHLSSLIGSASVFWLEYSIYAVTCFIQRKVVQPDSYTPKSIIFSIRLFNTCCVCNVNMYYVNYFCCCYTCLCKQYFCCYYTLHVTNILLKFIPSGLGF